VISTLSILPIFLIIALGYLAKRTVLDIKMLPALNLFVYYFAVPALLFDSARNASIEDLINLPAMIAFVVGASLIAVLVIVGSRLISPHRSAEERIIKMLNMTFANYAYMGIPVTFGILGEAAYLPTISIILMANIFIVGGTQVLMESHRHTHLNIKSIFSILDKSLLRSPIFLSTALGIFFSVYQLSVPAILEDTIEMLAPATIPVALFCLGASLQIKRTSLAYKDIAGLAFIKLIAHPAFTLGTFYLLGITDTIWLATTVLLTSLPTGALAHTIALKYGVFEKESSQIIVVTTVLSALTLSFWVNLLQ